MQTITELYKLNFHLELTSLDQCANRDPVKKDPVIRIKHLWSCFPPSSDLPFVMIPYMNIGLVANNWREWVPFISALVNMMSCWEGPKPENFKYWLHHAEELLEGLALELEREAACFYTTNILQLLWPCSSSSHPILCFACCMILPMFFHVFFNTSFDQCQ